MVVQSIKKKSALDAGLMDKESKMPHEMRG